MSSMTHWRLNEKEKESNLSLFRDLKEATASSELVLISSVLDLLSAGYISLSHVHVLDLGEWRCLQY